MEQSVKVKVKILAYEKGLLPTKLSQLENDVPYATQEWVKENAGSGGGFGNIDGGDIANPTPMRNKFDGGVIGG